ncbi:NAD(P)-dependent oxidoreductase [Salipiger bermudensis]|uniref:NAD(P)-dependent oxidoreductase n=1 Tax=Salipiger bermudensis TaxID=344736 RepID=UPI001A8F4FAA|nr:NAD(P)-dependent oxidoreductase [Salipiger bermudensis]MBN9678489.1 NAD(P)-dependent oxidoreductase [Salipiger bermudensis]
MTKRTVGFVGVGNIGTPMVLSLLREGLDVLVRDLRKEQASECLGAGARFAESNEQLAAECDTIGVAVVNDKQLNALFRSEGGLLDVVKPGTTLIVHSTVMPDTIKALGEETDARGIKMVDAQVSGGDLRAREGDLAIMCGGHPADIEANRDYFDAISRRTEHMGPRGSGAGAKLAIQMMTFGNWMAAIESMRLARALGLEEQTLANFATDTTADSWVAQMWGNYDRLLHNHPLAGSDDLYRMFDKDLFNSVVVGREAGIELPLTATSSQLMKAAMQERIEFSADTYAPAPAKKSA